MIPLFKRQNWQNGNFDQLVFVPTPQSYIPYKTNENMEMATTV
jgi:hypothetical protein